MNPQKFITKFTILIYQNSSYMYLYYLTYYYCRKYPQHTLNQWRILRYHELFCFLYALLSLDFTSKLQKVLIKVTTLIKDPYIHLDENWCTGQAWGLWVTVRLMEFSPFRLLSMFSSSGNDTLTFSSVAVAINSLFTVNGGVSSAYAHFIHHFHTSRRPASRKVVATTGLTDQISSQMSPFSPLKLE